VEEVAGAGEGLGVASGVAMLEGVSGVAVLEDVSGVAVLEDATIACSESCSVAVESRLARDDGWLQEANRNPLKKIS